MIHFIRFDLDREQTNRKIMRSKKTVLFCLLFFTSISSFANTAAIAAEREGPSHKKWMGKHIKQQTKCQSLKRVDLLMIGDSITEGWQSHGKKIWNEYYSKRNAFNIGISGDTTQGVLWRLQSGAFEKISPKLSVLMIGTNNHKHTPEEVAEGIKVNLKELKKQFPKTKILLLNIMPRGKDPSNTKLHLKNVKTNKIIKKYVDDKTVFLVDMNEAFLLKNGMLNMDLMRDQVHPNEAGYRVWAEAMEPFIQKVISMKK